MIAIHTKYIPASNTRGSRIKAYTASYGDRKGFSVTIPYRYDLNDIMVHYVAVHSLVIKYELDWDLTNMRYGDSADGKGFCFCFDKSIVKETIE